MTDVPNLKIGTKFTLATVTGVRLVERPDRAGIVLPKVLVDVRDCNGIAYSVDEVWIRELDSTIKSTGLWLKRDTQGLIMRASALGRMIEHYHVATLNDFLGHEVLIYPKKNGYRVIVAAAGNENDSLTDARKPTE